MIRYPAIGSADAPRPDDRDAEIVRRMTDGDWDAHRSLYERHGPRLLSYLVGRLGGDHGLAEEVLHDVMLEAWRVATTFRAEGSAKSWLFGIAHHKACNALRSRSRETLEADPDHGVDSLHGRNRAGGRSNTRAIDIGIDLEAALRALPDEQRAALELILIYGLSVVEAASALEVAPGTIKSRVFRAKRSMRHQLAREVDDEV